MAFGIWTLGRLGRIGRDFVGVFDTDCLSSDAC